MGKAMLLLFLPLAVLSLFFSPTSSHAQDWQRFWPASSIFPSGNDARSAVSGDFNEDGHQDLATANDWGLDIAVMAGVGDGSFSSPDQFDIGDTPRSITSGDFDEDGHLDLATANIHDSEVSVLLGTGTGAFTGPTNFPVGTGPNFITTGDFNADGHMDLVVTDWFSDNVAVLLGTGTGLFSSAFFQAAGDYPTGVVTGDFNEDGAVDLAVSDLAGGEVALLIGSGSGGFYAPSFFSVTDSLTGLVVGDFNGDGHRDIAATSKGGGLHYDRDVSILLGDGNGSMSQPSYIAVESLPSAIVIGDFNEDAYEDILVGPAGDRVAVLQGKGNGEFLDPEYHPVEDVPFFMAISDFDEDGHQDLAVVGGYGIPPDYATILLGNGEGGFFDAPRYDAGQSVTAMTVEDFDEDGHLDLAALYRYSTNEDVQILKGTGNGSFEAPYPIGVDIYDPVSITAEDFNNDAHQDLAIVYHSYYLVPNVYIYLGQGDGTFYYFITLPSGRNAIYLASGDFNEDNNVDLVTINETGDAVSVLIGEGDGVFLDPADYVIDAVPTDLILDDFNEDGHLDLAITTENGAGVAMLAGVGDGTFSSAVMYPGGGDLWSAVAADIDMDGHQDVLVTDPSRDKIVLFQGDGVGGLSSPVEYDLEPGISWIIADDFDRDGFADVAGTFSNSVSILNGTGTASFDVQTYVSSWDVTSLVAGDFDEDGFSDIVAGHRMYDDIAILTGNLKEIDVDIDCALDTIPAGGDMPFSLSLANLTDSLITVDITILVKVIGGTVIPLGPRRQPMAAGAEVTRSSTYTLPGGIPARSYIVSLEARALDGRLIDEDSFRVRVVAASANTPGTI